MPPRSQLVAMRESRRVVSALKEALGKAADFSSAVRKFKKGDVLIREGESNDSIYIILEGKAHLAKHYGTDTPVPVGTLDPGDFVGLLSFYSDERVFTTVHARTPVTTLCLTREQFDKLPAANPDLHHLLQQLIISNLAERYRRIVNLHLEVAALTTELERERNQLQHTLQELQGTRNRLIHQEKMAILGQLVAGIAHEINNPTSAVLRSADNLTEQLPVLLAAVDDDALRSTGVRLLSVGFDRQVLGTEEQRRRMEQLSAQYPRLSRPLVRILAQVGDKERTILDAALEDSSSQEGLRRIELLLQFFEVGTYLRSLKISGERIGNIVRSLKAYSREGKGDYEGVDIRKGLQDTLLILANRLKNISVALEFTDVPPVHGLAGDLNQVWTNVILNSCDSMQDSGSLTIKVGVEDAGYVTVSVADSGPGIPEHILPHLFEPNFTTKTASGNFGLGLGLAISNEIIQKHGGTIRLANQPTGGAICIIVLPVESR